MTNHEVDILLVDSHSKDSGDALRAFKEGGVLNAINQVTHGRAALDFLLGRNEFSGKVQVETPKLILLSLDLEDMSGIDVLREVRSDERTKAFPVIVLAASQEERGVMQSYKLGAQSCIVKPFDFDKFVEAVTDLGLGWMLTMRGR